MNAAHVQRTPGIARRLACMLYDGLLLFAVGFGATWVYYIASGGLGAEGRGRTLLQIFLVAVFAAYFLWCWLHGGQTLAMKTWRIRLIAPGRGQIPPPTAFLRFLLALFAVPTGIALGWALFDRDQQFLHDRIAGTRLVLV
ncbi:MAG TPA: RDD family protein [Burkholderiales bacterium]|nr:RDD family protein [Burkholderiales bacterium]